MNNQFAELSQNEIMETDGGFVILGVTITGALLVKIGAGVVIVGGAAMFAKGVYDEYKGN